MPMKKQPDGIKRIARGERKPSPDTGRKPPPEAYDIVLTQDTSGTKGSWELGWTERMPRGKWNAHALTGEHAMLLEDHTAAVNWLLSAFHGQEKTSEASTTTEAAQVAPAGEPVDVLDPVFVEPETWADFYSEEDQS